MLWFSQCNHAAYWKDTSTKYAIKKFDKDKISIKEIVNEINLMRIAFNPKIIQFYGVTKLNDELSLVLEYADGGTLEKYLRDNATTLIKWETQLKFANEIAAATSWLHHKKIMHGDLIFGCSRLQGLDYYTEGFTTPRGIIPYVDPKILNAESYDLTEKSDIYSLGMIFWELTSCSSPFDFEKSLKENDTVKIVLRILNGEREKPIPNTNCKFVALYKKCWEHEPDDRPDIHQVISMLNSIDPTLTSFFFACFSSLHIYYKQNDFFSNY
ncbi:kinase-like domain-containing protein [Rhizophagus clarus]|uniref:Kinase-like domain-containing protein n=1 Tax=Rhizophagus clarus TaxID=94130 RepID=A0A8H3L0K0_9GLOM|nr:kinase-like domain-containing protein [Rhizophagus clarus]